MAHKTLVGGTAYEISGGKTLVDGTAYSIAGGKTLVGGTAYDISFGVKPGVIDLWSYGDVLNTLTCVTFANGYWVVGGMSYDGSTRQARIAYATSPAGPWTVKDICGMNSSGSLNCIKYGGGNWVVGGATGNRAFIAYATALDGPWTYRDIWGGGYSSNGMDVVNALEYANGYWLAGGRYWDGVNYYARTAYCTHPANNWATRDNWNCYSGNQYARFTEIKSIIHANGYWVVAGANNGDGAYGYSSSTAPTATFSSKSFGGWGQCEYGGAYSITYGSYGWKAVGLANAGGVFQARLATASDITATIWGLGPVWDTWTTGWSEIGAYCAYQPDEDNWVFGGWLNKDAKLAYGKGSTATKNYLTLWTGPSSGAAKIYDVIYANGCWVAVGKQYANSTYYARIAYAEDFSQLGQTS